MCSGCFYLPKWNAYNTEVRAHHHAVTRHWIEQGIDGWRLDVPYFINHTFWRGFREVVKGMDEDLCIIAEEWREPEQWLQGDLADGTMNYTLRDLVLGFTADRTIDGHGFAEGMNRLRDRIPEGYHHGMLNLLGSHDTERVLTRHGDDVDAALLAYDLLYAAEGAPMLYYGDEVGMRGDNDPGCRGAMPWDEAAWSQRILGHVRGWGARRAASTALRRGAQDVHAIDADTVVIVRSSAQERVAVVVHRGAGTEIDVEELPQGGPWTPADRDEAPDGRYRLAAHTTQLFTSEGPR